MHKKKLIILKLKIEIIWSSKSGVPESILRTNQSNNYGNLISNFKYNYKK